MARRAAPNPAGRRYQPDPVFGEQSVALVTLRPGFSAIPEDLTGHCRRSLVRYKVPHEVHIEKTLPKNAVGKIAKPVLRERLKAAGRRHSRHFDPPAPPSL